MADILTLKKFEVLSPFEIKDELIKLARSRLADHAVCIPECGARQPQLGRHDAARGILPARPIRLHRKQAGDGASRGRRWHAASQRHRCPPGCLACDAGEHAGRLLPFGDGAFCHQEVRVRARRIRPRAGRFDHRRQLPGAGPDAGPQRADRARISDVGDVRAPAPGRQVRPLRGRGRHGRDVLHLQVAEGQQAAASRATRSRSAHPSLRPTSK